MNIPSDVAIEGQFIEPTVHAKFVDLRQEIAKSAEDIIRTKIPSSVLQLTTLCADIFRLSIEEVANVEAVPQNGPTTASMNKAQITKKRKVTQATEEAESEKSAGPDVEINLHIKEIIEVIKKEVLTCIDYLNTVKIWIQLNIPRIEDGNNFGVSIQEETVSELTRSEDASYSLLESMTKYFVARAKLVTKAHKYPGIQDYRQSIRELDQKQYINLKLSCLDIRNNMAIVYDMLLKNLEKILKPRTSHVQSLY